MLVPSFIYSCAYFYDHGYFNPIFSFPPIPYVHSVMTLTFAMQNNRIHSALAFLHVLKGNFDRLLP